VTLALALAACGDDDEEGAADTTEASSGTTAAAPSGTTAAAPSGTTAAAPSGTTAAAPSGTTAAGPAEPADCDSTDSIRLQLQWATQAQFAGYFAADDQGYFANRCLDVELVETPPDVIPQQQLADGQVDFAIAWVPKALQTREQGANIVNIAQMFQRSGTLQVSFKEANITKPEDFADRNIGNWGFGNEYEVFAALDKAGLDPATDVNLIGQDFNMLGLLSGDIDAAEAMTYNELAQVLEAENPETGELYTLDELNVISYEDVGVGMLQDAVWADGDKLANDDAYRDIATRFIAASIEGWVYCRDNAEACRDIVVAAGSQLGNSHQLWQMNEVNQLVWPAESNIGFIEQDAWDRTVDIALNTPGREGKTVLTAEPDAEAFTNDIVTAAYALLEGSGIDLVGADFEPIEVTLNANGE
jgi:NitT/TauT family transport system substrate-binding protein